MNESLAIVILAAGKGTRMGGKSAKVLVESFTGPLIHQVLSTALKLTPSRISVVVGFQGDRVQESVESWLKEKGDPCKVSFCTQKEQKGTGDAVRAALPSLENFTGEVLILCGDAPLIEVGSLQKLLKDHHEKKATVSVLSALLPEPGSYGRIIRDRETGTLTAITEAKDASPLELLNHEINSGVYVVDSAFLPGALSRLETDNAQGEYYLTDIVKRATAEGQTATSVLCGSSEEVLGVNTYADLHLVNSILQKRIREDFALNGVHFIHPDSVVLHPETKIGSSVTIGPSTVIGKNVVIGNRVIIEGLSHITDTTIDEGAHIKWSCRIDQSTIGENAAVGPFAHIRPGSFLGKEVKVGNFVETKKATLHDGAKASHLTYLGDAEIGKDANIGAGTITCNYDGYSKFKTTIEDGVFIGSNTALVAPVTIKEGATIGAGSTITKDVSADALALTRAEQREIAGWSKKKRQREQKKK